MHQDAALLQGVSQFGIGRWADIASNLLPGRTGTQIQHRWEEKLNPDLRKGAFTAEEVTILLLV